MNEPTPESMRETYLRASQGGSGPTCAIVGGAWLNEVTETRDYEPTATYIITEDGVKRCEGIMK